MTKLFGDLFGYLFGGDLFLYLCPYLESRFFSWASLLQQLHFSGGLPAIHGDLPS